MLKDRLPTHSAQMYWVGSYSSGREEARDCPVEKEDLGLVRPDLPRQRFISHGLPRGMGSKRELLDRGFPFKMETMAV